MDLCAKHSCKNLAMILWSCKVKKEDKIGAGPQKMVVNLSLIERYAGQSNTNGKVMLIFCCVRSTDKTKALLPIYSLCNRFELT